MHIDKDYEVAYVGGPNTPPNKSEMADGRHLEKSKNRHISKNVSQLLTDFDKIWHGDACRPSWPYLSLNFVQFFISKMGRRLEKSEIVKSQKLFDCF